jgi:hypothetical protein
MKRPCARLHHCMSERMVLLRTRGHRGGEEGRLQRRPGVMRQQVCVIGGLIGGLIGAFYTTYHRSFVRGTLLLLLPNFEGPQVTHEVEAYFLCPPCTCFAWWRRPWCATVSTDNQAIDWRTRGAKQYAITRTTAHKRHEK